MFLTFTSQEERRDYGGTSFIEIQLCRLPDDTSIESKVDPCNIENWQDDSLYVEDEKNFYESYSSIFDCGTYSDLEEGPVDLYGINYYYPDQIESLIAELEDERPEDYQILADWLEYASGYNGFYILGI